MTYKPSEIVTRLRVKEREPERTRRRALDALIEGKEIVSFERFAA